MGCIVQLAILITFRSAKAGSLSLTVAVSAGRNSRYWPYLRRNGRFWRDFSRNGRFEEGRPLRPLACLRPPLTIRLPLRPSSPHFAQNCRAVRPWGWGGRDRAQGEIRTGATFMWFRFCPSRLPLRRRPSPRAPSPVGVCGQGKNPSETTSFSQNTLCRRGDTALLKLDRIYDSAVIRVRIHVSYARG